MQQILSVLPILTLSLTITPAADYQKFKQTSHHKFGTHEVVNTGKKRNRFHGREAMLRNKTKFKSQRSNNQRRDS